MTEEYPNMGAFVYCNNNPVKLIDPDGNEAGDPETGGAPAKVDEKTGHLTEAQSSIRPSIDPKNPKYDKNPNTQEGGTCPNCLDPSTVGQNLLGLSYPGGNNPRTYAGDYSYSYVPLRLSEYPAIGHDRRYDNLGTAGAKGLFTDTRAIGADWRFVGEELNITSNPIADPLSRMQAGILGVGLGVAALPKTIYQLGKTNGLINIFIWYNISNVGVANTPDMHKHQKE